MLGTVYTSGAEEFLRTDEAEHLVIPIIRGKTGKAEQPKEDNVEVKG